MLLNILICDDNENDILILKKLIDQYFFHQPDYVSHKIKTCTRGQELLSLCEKECFHAVFLDIDMPDINGIETAKRLRLTDDRLIIVFVSSYPQYMRDSFEVQAFNFIEKPLSYECINHVCNTILEKYRSMKFNIISINTPNGEMLRNLNDLIMVEAIKGTKKDICFSFIDGEKIISQGTITNWENTLHMQGIVSPCRGVLINLRHLRVIKGNILFMSDGSNIIASRRRVKTLHELFVNHLLSFIN